MCLPLMFISLQNFLFFDSLIVCKSRAKSAWDCGSEQHIGSSFNTPQDCASGCRQQYSEERHIEFGFIGGPRQKECYCEKNDKCTAFSSHSGFDAYIIHDLSYQKTFAPNDWNFLTSANGVSAEQYVLTSLFETKDNYACLLFRIGNVVYFSATSSMAPLFEVNMPASPCPNTEIEVFFSLLVFCFLLLFLIVLFLKDHCERRFHQTRR